MKIIYQDEPFKFIRFTQQDFDKYQKKIAEDFANIFTTSKIGNPESNRQDALDQINKFMVDAAYDEMNCFLYFIYDDNNLPISVVMYTEADQHYHLEIVATREDYKCNGYASQLCLQSFKDLANNFGVDIITSTVNKENYPSLYLQESLINNKKIQFETFEDEDRIGFKYYIDELVDSPKMVE